MRPERPPGPRAEASIPPMDASFDPGIVFRVPVPSCSWPEALNSGGLGAEPCRLPTTRAYAADRSTLPASKGLRSRIIAYAMVSNFRPTATMAFFLRSLFPR